MRLFWGGLLIVDKGWIGVIVCVNKKVDNIVFNHQRQDPQHCEESSHLIMTDRHSFVLTLSQCVHSQPAWH